MAHIKLDRYPQVANIIDILFARVSSYLPGVNEQLLSFSLSLSLIAFSPSAHAAPQGDWEAGKSPGQNKEEQAQKDQKNVGVRVDDPNGLNLSEQQSVYVFTEADRALGYKMNGQPVVPGVTRIMINQREADIVAAAMAGPEKAVAVQSGSAQVGSEQAGAVQDGPDPVTQFKRCNIQTNKCTLDGTGAWCLGTDGDAYCAAKYSLACNPISSACVTGGSGQACGSDFQCTAANKRCDTYQPGTCVNGSAGKKCAGGAECPTKVCYSPGGVTSPKCIVVGSQPNATQVPCESDAECSDLKKCDDQGKCGTFVPGGSTTSLCAVDADCAQKFCGLSWSACVSGLPSNPAQKACTGNSDCKYTGCFSDSCRSGSSGVSCDYCTNQECDGATCKSYNGLGPKKCYSDSDCPLKPAQAVTPAPAAAN